VWVAYTGKQGWEQDNERSTTLIFLFVFLAIASPAVIMTFCIMPHAIMLTLSHHDAHPILTAFIYWTYTIGVPLLASIISGILTDRKLNSTDDEKDGSLTSRLST
jgi:hypothetical protein